MLVNIWTPSLSLTRVWLSLSGSWIWNISFAIIGTNIFISASRASLSQFTIRAMWWFYHGVIYLPPIIILIVLQSIGFLGYSPGYTPCWLKPVKIGNLLLAIIPFTASAGMALVFLSGAIALLLYRSGFQGLLRQSRLVLFVLATSFYTVCAQIPSIQNFRSDPDDTTAYFECLVNNWIATQLYRHPEVRLVLTLMRVLTYLLLPRHSWRPAWFIIEQARSCSSRSPSPTCLPRSLSSRSFRVTSGRTSRRGRTLRLLVGFTFPWRRTLEPQVPAAACREVLCNSISADYSPRARCLREHEK